MCVCICCCCCCCSHLTAHGPAAHALPECLQADHATLIGLAPAVAAQLCLLRSINTIQPDLFLAWGHHTSTQGTHAAAVMVRRCTTAGDYPMLWWQAVHGPVCACVSARGLRGLHNIPMYRVSPSTTRAGPSNTAPLAYAGALPDSSSSPAAATPAATACKGACWCCSPALLTAWHLHA